MSQSTARSSETESGNVLLYSRDQTPGCRPNMACDLFGAALTGEGVHWHLQPGDNVGRQSFKDAAYVDATFTWRQSFGTCGVQELFGCKGFTCHCVAHMYKREVGGRNQVKVFEPASRTGEMQRVDENPGIVAVRRFDNSFGRSNVRHHRPGEELKQDRQVVLPCKVGKSSEPLGESTEVWIIRRRDDVSCAEFRPRRRERFERHDIDLGRDFDEFDVADTYAGIVEPGLGVPHRRRVE